MSMEYLRTGGGGAGGAGVMCAVWAQSRGSFGCY